MSASGVGARMLCALCAVIVCCVGMLCRCAATPHGCCVHAVFACRIGVLRRRMHAACPVLPACPRDVHRVTRGSIVGHPRHPLAKQPGRRPLAKHIRLGPGASAIGHGHVQQPSAIGQAHGPLDMYISHWPRTLAIGHAHWPLDMHIGHWPST